MKVIDSSKVLQDFLAQELGVVSVRLDALEQRFDVLGCKVDEVDRRVQKRHEQIMSALAWLAVSMSIRERIARLESKQRAQQ